MADITLNIGGNTRQLDRDIQKTVNKVYSINLKTKGDQPLGRITGQVNEFNKSLDASNARVIAFGASAGIIFGVERAFAALISSTIEVQKSLQDINVILNVSAQNLQKFGGELFNIARNTGQSFQEVAKAATEFSRQGLGVEETLKRTNEALILSRLSGLDAAKSVESLTAAVNSFASQAVTATEVVNKFATVDAAFAVSSADLADAIARVGSSAAQSGVSLDELIAIVTSAQQTTARGGAVIGNSFKTIFTRLQREKVVDLLESLGISGTDASGQVKSTIQLLQDLGKVYDTLGSQQQAYVAEQVGGVFQINILKAALADLGKEYSIYSSALNVSAGATDQAIRRNEELNKTYAAQINALQENARQLAAAGGERLLGPTIDRLVGGTNTLIEGFRQTDGQGVGAVLGKGILDGLGQFIAGPGLALIGGVLLKLFRDLAKFATGSVQQLLGLNTAATQQRDLQQSINQILSKNPQLLELALKGEQGLNAAANSLLANLQKQTVELQKQAQVAAQISKAFVSQAGVRVVGGVPVVPTPKPSRPGKAAGYIPNFAEEFQAKELGATSSVKAVRGVGKIGGKRFGANNQEFQLKNFAGTGETAVIPKYGNGIKEAAKMIARGESGSILDKSDRNRAKGFIPNFAINKKEKIISEKPYGYLVPSITPDGGIGKDGVIPPGTYQGIKFSGTTAYAPSRRRSQKVPTSIETSISQDIYDAAARYSQQLQPLGRSISANDAKEGFNTTAGARGAVQSVIGSAFEVAITKSLDYKAAQRESGGNFDVRGGQGLSQVLKLFNVRGIRLADFKVSTSPDNIDSFRKKILKEQKAGAFSNTEIKVNAQKQAVDELRNDPKWASAFRADGTLRAGYAQPEGFDKALEEKTKEIEQKRYNPRLISRRGRAAGFIPNFANIFQAFPNKAERAIVASKSYGSQKILDTLSKSGVRVNTARRLFGKETFEKLKRLLSGRSFSAGLNRDAIRLGDLSYPPLAQQAKQLGIPTSILEQVSRNKSLLNNFSGGYIPNFAAIQDAINRERSAGIPSSQIYLAQEKALTSANPMGLGVFNKRDEPTARKRREQMRSKGFARGYIPNFAIEDPDTQAADFGTAATAITAQLSTLAFAFAFNGGQYKESLKQLTAANLKRAKEELKQSRIEAKRLEQRGLGNFATTAREDASRRFRESATPGILTKGKAFVGANALGLSIAAPILGETIKNIAGQETATQRGIGAAGSALGQIGSFAATGALIAPGPVGLGVGAAVGALLTVPGVIDSFLTDFPELQKESLKAAQELTQFGEASSRVIQASELYATVLSDNTASAETVSKAQKGLAQALNSIPAEYRDRLATAAGTGTIAEESAKIQEDLFRKSQVKEINAQLGKSTGEARSAFVKSTAASTALSSNFGLALASRLGIGKSVFGNPTEILGNEENTKAINSLIQQSLTGGEFTPEVVKSLAKIPTISANAAPRGGTQVVKDTGDLRKFLEQTGQFDPSTIEKLIEQANIPGQFENIVEKINQGIITTKNEARSTVDALTKANAKQKEYLENVRKASAAIDAASSRLEKNVAIQNLFKSAIENISENARSFSENFQIEQKLTQPREVLESLIGADKTPTRRLAAQEGLATIRETERSGIAAAGLELKGAIRDILQTPFQENINKLRENLGLTKQGFKGDADQIESQSSDIINKTTTEYENLNSVMQSVEGYMAEFVKGQISTQQLLSQSKNELSKVGIDVSRGSQASDAIEKAVAELQVKTLQEQIKAFQQRAKLASETKQAILQSRIEQALGTFGGFEGFMNRPQEEQNYIQRIAPDLRTVAGLRESTAFRYNNPESVREQERLAPELGRAFANVYTELINQSGGAFRDFLQETIDKGIQQTGTTSRGSLAGAGLAGGFDDIVRGRQQDIEQQLKLAENQLKITTDPALQRDLQGFIDSIRKLPGGTKGIAQLQTQKSLGIARQSDFAQLYGKYENEALNRLKDISPELAASLESAISLSDDPLVAEAQLQSALQTDMIGYFSTIQDAVLQIATLGNGSVVQSELPQLQRYTPKVTEEQQKKADEFRKKQEEVAKKTAEIKAKQAQEAAMPKDNRTIAEIEAETRVKRDQNLGVQSPIGLYTGGYINGERADEALQANLSSQDIQARAEFEQFRSQEAQRKAAADAELQRVLAQKEIFDAPARAEFEQISRGNRIIDTRNNAISEENRIRLLMAENDRLFRSETPMAAPQAQKIPEQLFTQQETAFNNNTSAITTLNGNLESLNSTFSTFEANFANLNNFPGIQAPAAATTQQPSTQTNVGPFSVVVNATNEQIQAEINQKLENLKLEIFKVLSLNGINAKVTPKTQQ